MLLKVTKRLYAYILLSALLCTGEVLLAQTAITSATFNNVTTGLTTSSYVATSPSDASGGITANTSYTINYGQTRNQFITDYTLGATLYDNFVLPDTLIIQRTDAGRQLIIFYEYGSTNTAPDPDEINIQPEQQDNEDALYESGLSNAGYDNILVNSATNFANVERIDIIYYSGVVTSTPANAVFPIIERGGNDDIRVAAIRGLDASGNPNDYYPTVVRIRDDDGDWGSLGVNHTSIVMRRQDATSNPLPQTILGSQVLNGTAVAFDEFGVGADEIVYGYSIFADDVTVTGSDLVDFSNATNYPTNTGSGSGLDLIAGISTAVASDDNLRKATGPGGYKAALNTWLKANVGVTTATDASGVTDWQDQFLGNHDATNLGTSPTYRDGSASGLEDINFNPTIDFISASETGLQIADNTDFNTATSYQKKSINIAIRTGDDVTTKQQIYEQGGATRGLNVYLRAGNLYVGAWNGASDGAGSPWSFDAVSTAVSTDTEYIVSIEFDGNNTTTGSLRVYLNGQSVGTIANVGLLYAHADDIGIGDVAGSSLYDDGGSAAASFYGSIPELIYCNEPSAFSSAQRNRIESYLALKYGITLNQSTPINYVNSDGITIFNTTSNASIGGFLEYNNDIAGIGRDDASEFIQMESQSENAGSLVRISRNSEIGVDNTWMIWGNDGGALTETATGTPDTVDLRLTRVWRMSKVGNLGVVDISFDINDLGIGTNPNNLSLLIGGSSSAGDFSSATLITSGAISTIDGRTFITFSDVNISNGEYFTLGTDYFRCSPGGVETDLLIWFRADEGTNTTVNGANVTSWENQTQFTNNASEVNQGGTPEEPTYVSSAYNFNPSVRFTDPGNTNNSYLETASNPITGDMTLISVFATTQSEGTAEFWSSPALIGAEAGGTTNDFALGLSGGRVHAKIAAGDGLGTRSPVSPTYSDGQVRIATATRVQAASGALELYIDSENVASGTSDNTVLDDPASIGIGNHTDPITSAQFAGDIPEVIIYADDLTSDERTRVETYVAIKYGITRNDSDDGGTVSIDERDYRSASGTVVWDYDGQGASFYNDIAGIGRDDIACFEQRQSSSINSDEILTIGLGTIADDNISNPNSFASDDSYLLWGNDDGATAFASRTTGVTGIGTVTERMTRIWRADETSSDVGNTAISFDLTGLGYTGSLSDYQLIVSDNSDLSSATLYQAATYSSNVVTFTGVNLADGQYFTLGTARSQCGPGGVSTNLGLWLRADSEVFNTGTTPATDGQTVATWADQGPNAANATDASNLTTYETNTVNFNPAIEFNNDATSLEGTFTTTTSGLSIFTAAYFGSGSADGDAFFEFRNGSDRNFFINNRYAGNTAYSTNFDEDSWNLWSIDHPAGNTANIYQNGATFESSYNSTLSAAPSGTFDYTLGDDDTGANDFVGFLGDVIFYEGTLTTTERRQIETYLAIKYGVTIDQTSATDYIFSDGTTVIWDASTNVGYDNDIAGIGRDDASCFFQRQATSANSDDILTIGHVEVANSNSENANSFVDDGDYLIWGNNNGSTAQASAETSDVPAIIAERMSRVWRVDDTGSVGETEIQFDLTGLGWGTDAEDYRLMIAGSGSGGTMAGATLVTGGTFNGSVLSFSGIDLADGEYFTLGVVESCGPGGVNTNLALWLRADLEVFSDAGTTTAVNGNDVIQWNDQGSTNNDASEVDLGGASPVEPVYQTGDVNYNPSILFTDQNTTNSSYLLSGSNTVTGNMSLIAVFTTAQSQGSTTDFSQSPALIGANSGGTDDYGLGMTGGRIHINAANNSSLNLRSPSGTTYINGEPYIAMGTRVQAASGALNLYVNSRLVANNTASDNTSLTSPTGLGIGNHSVSTSAGQFQGEIMEAIVFSEVLTAQERLQLSSYLAVKYGVTLTNDNDNDATTNEIITGSIREGDYLAGDGGVIWDYASRGATYFNDIAGIGRDDLSCLNQTHSKSENDDAIVDIEIGSFSEDDSWFIWGNDNATMEAPDNKERPETINSRLNREWQAQETGTVGTVTVTFDLTDITGAPSGSNDLTQVRLMIDQDGDFTTGVTLVSPSSFDSFNNTISFDVDFTGATGYYFTLGSQQVDALPVELFRFEVNSIDKAVQVNWSTATETNNSHFTIERSTDGKSFIEVADITGAGNSSSIQNYTYIDHVEQSGTYYYRIKQTDFNGLATYSELKGVLVTSSNSYYLKIYPNPNNTGLLKYDFEVPSENAEVQLTIISTSGDIVLAHNHSNTLERGTVDISSLRPGIYFVRLKSGNSSFTKRLIVR